MVKCVALALVALGLGCKLTEVVTAPAGDAILVVQSVMNATRTRQTVLVQRSQTGAPTVNVSLATVQLTDLDPKGCGTPVVQLTETSAGVYSTSAFCPLSAGDRITLRVTTRDGQVVTGATRIPGVQSIVIRAGQTTAQLQPASLAIDRTKDTVYVTAQLRVARALQIEAVRTTTNEDPTLTFASDTLSVTVPGDLVDPFNDRTIFRAGCYYQFTVAAMDTNYFDFTRSITNPLTGRGFVNHLTGGVGVFGSVAPTTYELRVTAPQTDPREGVYRFTGRVAGVAVDVRWDMYRDQLSATRVRAFVDGQWVTGLVHTSANATFSGNAFRGTMFGDVNGNPTATYVLTGNRPAPGTSFPVAVRGVLSGSLDTVSAVQVTTP